MPSLAGLINCLQDGCGLSSETNGGYLFADKARFRSQEIPHTTQNTVHNLARSEISAIPRRHFPVWLCDAWPLDVWDCVFLPMVLTCRVYYHVRWVHSQTMRRARAGDLKNSFIHTKVVSVNRTFNPKLQKRYYKLWSGANNLHNPVHVFDVWWCWPGTGRGGCHPRTPGHISPAWSVPGGDLTSEAGHEVASHHWAHLRPGLEAGPCLVPEFRSCLWSAVPLTARSHWRDVHCVRCRERLSEPAASSHWLEQPHSQSLGRVTQMQYYHPG